MLTTLLSSELQAPKGGLDGYVILSHYEEEPDNAWDFAMRTSFTHDNMLFNPAANKSLTFEYRGFDTFHMDEFSILDDSVGEGITVFHSLATASALAQIKQGYDINPPYHCEVYKCHINETSKYYNGEAMVTTHFCSSPYLPKDMDYSCCLTTRIELGERVFKAASLLLGRNTVLPKYSRGFKVYEYNVGFMLIGHNGNGFFDAITMVDVSSAFTGNGQYKNNTGLKQSNLSVGLVYSINEMEPQEMMPVVFGTHWSACDKLEKIKKYGSYTSSIQVYTVMMRHGDVAYPIGKGHEELYPRAFVNGFQMLGLAQHQTNEDKPEYPTDGSLKDLLNWAR